MKTKILFLILLFSVDSLNAQTDSLNIRNEAEFKAFLDDLGQEKNMTLAYIKSKGKVDENGDRFGNWIVYADIDGRKKFYEGEYNFGVKEGLWKMYDLEGSSDKIKCEEIWKQDSLKKWTCYADPEVKKYRIESEDFIPHQIIPYIQYWGSVSSWFCLSSNLKGGYYEASKLLLDVFEYAIVNNSEKEVKLSFWGFNEQLEQERIYAKGREVKRVEYLHKYGEIIEVKTFKYGQLARIESSSGEFIGKKWIVEYHPNGYEKFKGYIIENTGDKSGLWTEYYLNGNKKCMGNFKNGNRHGVWKFWDEEKNLLKKEKYKNGHLVSGK